MEKWLTSDKSRTLSSNGRRGKTPRSDKDPTQITDSWRRYNYFFTNTLSISLFCDIILLKENLLKPTGNREDERHPLTRIENLSEQLKQIRIRKIKKNTVDKKKENKYAKNCVVDWIVSKFKGEIREDVNRKIKIDIIVITQMGLTKNHQNHQWIFD